jgi:hypothetical protein
VSDARGPQDSAAGNGWRARIHFWVEILNKLALPTLTVMATIVGTWLTLTISERNNARATINQREQAESNLRSNMFSQLVNPLIDQSKLLGGVPGTEDTAAVARERADRLTLLAELLALNFHEHFELGPLLRYVERLEGQTPANRRTLRSVARRVTGRQIAMLGWTGDSGCATAEEREAVFQELWLVSTAEEAAYGPQTCFLPQAVSASQGALELQCTRSGGDHSARQSRQLVAVSPDCRDRLLISLNDLDWANQSLAAYITVERASASKGAGAAARSEFVEFTLSPYSLPFSDNTLLRSGNRFGLYIRQVEPSRDPCEPPGCDPSERLMRLSFVWFPDDFFPPRERPTDFAEVRKALKLGRQPD